MILFIVNEKSGNGRSKRAWNAIEPILRARQAPYRKISAPTAEEALEQAELALQETGADAIVAVGGDGTVHRLIPLALKFQKPLGLIPSGSGNDTALAFGLPKDPAAALDIVLRGQTRRSDLIALEHPDGKTDYTLISVATGLDGAVARDVNESRYKGWCNRLGVGRLAYIIGLLRMLFAFKPQTVQVTVDGNVRRFQRCWLAAVANLPTYGGGLKICPDARPDDGTINVCIASGCSAVQLLLVFPTVLTGRHVRSRFVTMLQGKQIAVEAPEPMPAFGDGEPAGETPVRAAALPGQLLILASGAG